MRWMIVVVLALAASGAAAQAPTLEFPKSQVEFEQFIADFARRAEAAPNPVAIELLRRERTKAFNKSPLMGPREWLGQIEQINAARDGRASIRIVMREGIQVLSNDGRMVAGQVGVILPNSPVWQAILPLRVGQWVKFTAGFMCRKDDCPMDPSDNAKETLITPAFLADFRSLAPID